MKWPTILTVIFSVSAIQLAFSAHYDPLLLRAQASMFPKIIMLDQAVKEKTVNNEIIISILHEQADLNFAEKLKKLIIEKYGHQIGKTSLSIKLSVFSDTVENQLSTAYILLNGNRKTHLTLTRFAAENNRLVFCYDYNDFKYNTLISVMVKEKTYIFMNKSALHAYDIKFNPFFYKIVKILE